jgi:hypothetical protein
VSSEVKTNYLADEAEGIFRDTILGQALNETVEELTAKKLQEEEYERQRREKFTKIILEI